MIYTGPIFDFGAFMAVSSGSESTINLYSQGDKYRGFNCLWGIGAGIQWDRLRLDVGGDFGMVNKDNEFDELTWNKPVYVTLTCFF